MSRTILDCGCCITSESGRVWCPTCAAGGSAATAASPDRGEAAKRYIEALEARALRAEKVVDAARAWRDADAESAGEEKRAEGRFWEALHDFEYGGKQ